MEIDPVDAIAEPIMGPELRSLAIGQSCELLHLVIARNRTERLTAVLCPWRLGLDDRA